MSAQGLVYVEIKLYYISTDNETWYDVSGPIEFHNSNS